MPSPSTTVGPLAIPVAVGATDAPIQDPTIVGLLGYIGYWLKWGLDAKLATITAPGVNDACPVAHRYDVDPSMLVQRISLPALFIWCNERSKPRQFTTMKKVVDRTLQIMWVYENIKASTLDPESIQRINAGVLNAAEAILERAFDRKAHPTYAPTGYPAGTDIRVAISLNEVTYLGGQQGFLKEFLGASVREAAANAGTSRRGRGTVSAIQNAYPCLKASVMVTEEIGQDTPLETDIAHDMILSIKVNELGDLNNTIGVLDRVLEAPDGSE